MIARRIRPLVSAVVFAVSGCTLEPEFVQLAFEGRVTDAETGSVIAGATVSLIEALAAIPATPLASGTSDAQGHYTLSYSQCADVPVITAEAVGYRPLGVAVNCQEGTQTLNLVLNPEP
jgi:hypothetical protein